MSIPLHESTHERIERVLGRKILHSEAGSINSFHEFSESDMNDFKSLMNDSSVMVIALIRFKMKKNEDLFLAASYYQSVFQNGKSVVEWMKENNL